MYTHKNTFTVHFENGKVMKLIFLPFDDRYSLLLHDGENYYFFKYALENFLWVIDPEDRDVIKNKNLSEKEAKMLATKFDQFKSKFPTLKDQIENTSFFIEDLIEVIHDNFDGFEYEMGETDHVKKYTFNNGHRVLSCLANNTTETLVSFIKIDNPNFKLLNDHNDEVLLHHLVSLVNEKCFKHIAEKVHLFPRNEKIIHDGCYVYIMRQINSNIYKFGYSKKPHERLCNLNLTRTSDQKYVFVKLYRTIDTKFEDVIKKHFKKWAFENKKELFQFGLFPLNIIDNLYEEYILSNKIVADYNVNESHGKGVSRVGDVRAVESTLFFDTYSYNTYEENDLLYKEIKKEVKNKYIYTVEMDVLDFECPIACEQAFDRDERKYRDLPNMVGYAFSHSLEVDPEEIEEEN